VRWSDVGDARCSVARALSVVGDRWTMLLVREALIGTRRFEDFQANTGASRALVADCGAPAGVRAVLALVDRPTT
jgi:DNA-binding HxlR family transcriptional regulator